MQRLIEVLPTCLISEVRRLGGTLKQWPQTLLAYFDTNGASNGDTEAVNGLVELQSPHRPRFRNRDNYRLRCLFITGELIP